MTLTTDELEYIKKYWDGTPTPGRRYADIMFSEHCSYKSSRPILKLSPPREKKL